MSTRYIHVTLSSAAILASIATERLLNEFGAERQMQNKHLVTHAWLMWIQLHIFSMMTGDMAILMTRECAKANNSTMKDYSLQSLHHKQMLAKWRQTILNQCWAELIGKQQQVKNMPLALLWPELRLKKKPENCTNTLKHSFAHPGSNPMLAI